MSYELAKILRTKLFLWFASQKELLPLTLRFVEEYLASKNYFELKKIDENKADILFQLKKSQQEFVDIVGFLVVKTLIQNGLIVKRSTKPLAKKLEMA